MKILNLLKQAICNNLEGSNSQKIAISKFIVDNECFYDNFINESNFEKYVNIYKDLSDQMKRKWNVYYLSLLHTINYIKCESSFVSATTNYSVAMKFKRNFLIIGWYYLDSSGQCNLI